MQIRILQDAILEDANADSNASSNQGVSLLAKTESMSVNHRLGSEVTQKSPRTHARNGMKLEFSAAQLRLPQRLVCSVVIFVSLGYLLGQVATELVSC